MAKMNQENVIQVLIQYASGQVEHKYVGMCPDAIEGSAVRDPDCPVCQALEIFGDRTKGLYAKFFDQ